MSKKGKQRTWKTHSTLKGRVDYSTLRNQKLSTIHGDIKATLRSLQASFLERGDGNMYDTIAVPQYMIDDATENAIERGLNAEEAKKKGNRDAICEWVAMNTIDFYNEVQLLYSICALQHFEEFKGLNQGFPPGFVYRFPGKEIINGAQYVEEVISWIEEVMEDGKIFPELADDDFPEDFLDVHMNKVYTRIVRIFAIMYTKCFKLFKEIDAVKALNYGFKHVFYYVNRFDLVREKEYDAFKQPHLKGVLSIADMSLQYAKDKKNSKEK